MPSRNQFSEYSQREISAHKQAGKNLIDDLEKIRGVADFMSIGAVNMLTRTQNYVASAHALTEKYEEIEAALDDEEVAGVESAVLYNKWKPIIDASIELHAAEAARTKEYEDAVDSGEFPPLTSQSVRDRVASAKDVW